MVEPSLFDEVYKIMLASFPSPELRNKDGQRALFENENYHILTVSGEDGAMAGFLAYWKLPHCVFIEHLAVDPCLRGGGLGAKLVQNCQKEADGLPVVLEVELPHSEINRRRIGFYERLGFCYTEHRYIQPLLKPGDEALALAIMSWPQGLNQEQFETCRDEIFRLVYPHPAGTNGGK